MCAQGDDTRRAQDAPPCKKGASSSGLGGTKLIDSDLHWARTKRLMITALVIWAIFGFAIHLFVRQLNEIVILGFPLGFYMAAQGSLIAFVVLIFWFARRQDVIDRECGVAEAD
jgi:putative solute:sodium symporter small subunit